VRPKHDIKTRNRDNQNDDESLKDVLFLHSKK
jgi:hypothetical protein